MSNVNPADLLVSNLQQLYEYYVDANNIPSADAIAADPAGIFAKIIDAYNNPDNYNGAWKQGAASGNGG